MSGGRRLCLGTKPKTLQCCPKQLRQSAAIASAHRQLRSIPHDDHVLSVEPGLQLFDFFDVHEGRAVDADEEGGIEFLLYGAHSFPEQVCFVSNVQAHIITSGFNPIDLIVLKEEHAPTGFHDESLGLLPRSLQLTQEGVQLLIQLITMIRMQVIFGPIQRRLKT